MVTTNIFANPLTQGQSIFTSPTTPTEAIQLGKGPIKISQTPNAMSEEIYSWKKYTQPLSTRDVRKTTSMPNVLTMGKDVITNIYEQRPKMPGVFTTKTSEQPKLTDPKAIQLLESFKTSQTSGVSGQPVTQLFMPRTPAYGETVFPTYPKTPEERFIVNRSSYETDVAKMGETAQKFKKLVAKNVFGYEYTTPQERERIMGFYNEAVQDLNRQNELYSKEQQKYATLKTEYDTFLSSNGKKVGTEFELPTDKYATAESMYSVLSDKEKSLIDTESKLRTQQERIQEYVKQAAMQAGTGSGWKNALLDLATAPTLMLGQLSTGIALSGRKAGLLIEGATLPTTTGKDILGTFITEPLPQVPKAIFQTLSPIQYDPRTGKVAFNVEGAINLALAYTAVQSIGAARVATRTTTPTPGSIKYIDTKIDPILTNGKIVGQKGLVRGTFIDKTGATYAWLDKALGRTPKGQLRTFEISTTLDKAGVGRYNTIITDPFTKKIISTHSGTLKNIYEEFVKTTKPTGVTETLYKQETIARPDWSLRKRTGTEIGRLESMPEASIIKYPAQKLRELGITSPRPTTAVVDIKKFYAEWLGKERLGDTMLFGKQLTPMRLITKGKELQPIYGKSAYLRNIRTMEAPTFAPSELPVPIYKPIPVYMSGALRKFGSEVTRVTQAMARSKIGAITSKPITSTISTPTGITYIPSITAAAGTIPPTSVGLISMPFAPGIGTAGLALINVPSVLSDIKSGLLTEATPITETTSFLGTLVKPVTTTEIITDTTPVTEVVPITEPVLIPNTRTRTIVERIIEPAPITSITSTIPGLITGAGLSALWPTLGTLGGGPGEVEKGRPRGVIAGVNVNFLRNFFFEKVQSEIPSRRTTKGKEIMFSELGTPTRVSGSKTITKDILSKSRIASNSAPFSKKLSLIVKQKKRAGNTPGIINYEGINNPLRHFL